jgi:hypothetical protein
MRLSEVSRTYCCHDKVLRAVRLCLPCPLLLPQSRAHWRKGGRYRGAGLLTSVMVTVAIPVPVVAIGWPVAAALPPTALILLTLYTRNTEHCFLEPAEWDVLYMYHVCICQTVIQRFTHSDIPHHNHSLLPSCRAAPAPLLHPRVRDRCLDARV